MRYPLVIERSTLRIRVGGRVRAFKGCALGERVAGMAEIDGLVVSVICTDGRPGEGFGLARLEGKPLNELMVRGAEALARAATGSSTGSAQTEPRRAAASSHSACVGTSASRT